MKQQFLIKENHPCLLIFFAGWGMDANPFGQYRPQGCDWMICYDYRRLDFDFSLLGGYSSVRLVAWSMGVWAASQVFAACPGLIRESVAVNGTPCPVDAEKGIAPTVFHATLEGLNEQSLVKFYRRMCGSSSALEAFLAKAPRRTQEELREELEAIGRQAERLPESAFRWDGAVVGSRDRIFLPTNQLHAWETVTPVCRQEIDHYSEVCFRQVLRWTNN